MLPATPVIARPDRMLLVTPVTAHPDQILLVECASLMLILDHIVLLTIVLGADMVCQTLAVANLDCRTAF